MLENSLSESQKKDIIQFARYSLLQLFKIDNPRNIHAIEKNINTINFSGAFVSLYNNQQLRGCIGRFSNKQTLSETIKDLTQLAATADTRFEPLNVNEIHNIKIEISLLTPLEQFSSLNDFELGKHGIYIKKGVFSGTFLPQVANKTSWTKEEFIAHCSHDKAGIGWDGWRNAELYRYEAIVIHE